MPGKRNRKKPLNITLTLQNYIDRMKAEADTHPDFLCDLQDKYLSTYDVYSTVVDPENISDELQCSAILLLKLARTRHVNVKGVTSERKKEGVFICKERQTEPCLYCGKYSFWGNRKTSKYAVRSCDYVYAQNTTK